MSKKKGNQGGYLQFIPAAPAKTEVNRKGRTITLRHALRARFIHHKRQQIGKKQESLLRDAVTNSGYVKWKDTDGARRRGWHLPSDEMGIAGLRI